jgi:N-acetylneuraminate synthase
MLTFNIENKKIGKLQPCFFIAEMGLSHEGSLGYAHAFIDSAAQAGTDAVKFQTHIADAEGTTAEEFRIKTFPQDATRQAYWARTSFTQEQWSQLKRHAEEKGLIFLSTPFSKDAAILLENIGISAWKIGSGDINNTPLLEFITQTRKPVLLSSGMSYYQEIDRAIHMLKTQHIPTLLFQCTSLYPCPAEHVGLNLLTEFRERYAVPIGLSDHSGKTATGIAAVTLGADALEHHITWHRGCFGPDVIASITFEELANLIADVRFIEKILMHPVTKDNEADSLQTMRSLFTKSVVAATAIPAGTILALGHFAFKKPGTGIPAGDYVKLLGKAAKRGITQNSIITWDDIDD